MSSPGTDRQAARLPVRPLTPSNATGSDASHVAVTIVGPFRHTNQEIAAELFISLSTVKTHIARIQEKLDARNRVEVAAQYWESLIGDATA